jgi:hypothetical protein
MLMVGRWRAPSIGGLRLLLLVAAVPTALTVGGEIVGLVSPTNMVRAILAAPLGFAIAWTVCRALSDEMKPAPMAR